MKRTKHSLSHYVLSTFNMGELIPVANFEVLPGDSIRMATSCLLRVSPLMAPVMHPITVRLHHWFVPYRVLDDGWEDFITGGPDGLGAEIPTLQLTTGDIGVRTLSNYLGVPNVPSLAGTDLVAFPFRAYNRIYNEFYRDQDLTTEVPDDSLIVRNVAWEKDIFTAARPWTQKGPAVTVPLGTSAPVIPSGPGIGPQFNITSATGNPKTLIGSGAGATANWGAGAGGAAGSGNSTGIATWQDSGLIADLQNSVGGTVNDIRLAFALQRYQEARAQYGSRYTEYLRYLGVRSSDARLQRPEYLGGGRATISFSEVLKTGEGDTPVEDSPIGEMRGHGISAIRSRRWVRFFEEHGIVMTLASIRPKTLYTDGLHRSWRKFVKEEFWQKELEQVGQQDVRMHELYADAASLDQTFGYNDRYYDYRHIPSYVTGEFRTIMNDWHLARSFASAPALNQSFILCVPSKRIHAEQTQDVLWGMFSHSIQARRMVGRKTIGRVF